MTRTGWLAMLTAVAVACSAAGAQAIGARNDEGDEDGHRSRCSVATLKGTYGIQIQGTRPTGPGGPIESVIGVVVRHYDGHGQFTQITNEKGSISGIAPLNREGFGTYEVNADCTGTHTIQIPGVPFSITDRFVVLDNGREVRNAVMTPEAIMITGVSKKTGAR